LFDEFLKQIEKRGGADDAGDKPYRNRCEREMLTLADISHTCIQCNACGLRSNGHATVAGEGNPYADIVFVGECPGEEEIKQGRPFVGPAGQILERILEAMDINREHIYITNVVKCRPPGNRLPKNEEVEACKVYLAQQIAAIRPRIIVCLGDLAAQTLIDPDARVIKIRGHWFMERDVKIIATLHPAAILRDPKKKRPVWEDFKKIRFEYEKMYNMKIGCTL
jgi:uracil-DNA glycosylase